MRRSRSPLVGIVTLFVHSARPLVVSRGRRVPWSCSLVAFPGRVPWPCSLAVFPGGCLPAGDGILSNTGWANPCFLPPGRTRQILPPAHPNGAFSAMLATSLPGQAHAAPGNLAGIDVALQFGSPAKGSHRVHLQLLGQPPDTSRPAAAEWRDKTGCRAEGHGSGITVPVRQRCARRFPLGSLGYRRNYPVSATQRGHPVHAGASPRRLGADSGCRWDDGRDGSGAKTGGGYSGGALAPAGRPYRGWSGGPDCKRGPGPVPSRPSSSPSFAWQCVPEFGWRRARKYARFLGGFLGLRRRWVIRIAAVSHATGLQGFSSRYHPGASGVWPNRAVRDRCSRNSLISAPIMSGGRSRARFVAWPAAGDPACRARRHGDARKIVLLRSCNAPAQAHIR
jgi:hypothetical protein